MRSTFKVLFYVNRSKEREGRVPVMGRITINGRQAQFSCKLYVTPSLWSAEGNRAKGRSREAQEVNRTLESLRTQIAGHYRRLQERDASVSACMVRNALLGLDESNETLLDAFGKLETEGGGQEGARSSRQRTLRVVRQHLSDFLRRRYRREDMRLNELTEAFIRDFCTYLRTERGLAQTTVWVYSMPLKRVVTRAHNDGVIARNPFAAFHVGPRVKERAFLTESELRLLMHHPLPDPALALTRDIFVFGCLTGISFIDIRQLTRKELVEINGAWWIVAHRQKTGIPYRVRLLDVPLDILRRRSPSHESRLLFEWFGYRRVCRQLKRIARLCGLSKPLTFHVARHTFATLALCKGMPIESVSKILGHTRIATTQIYARVTTEKLSHDIAAFGERLELSLT